MGDCISCLIEDVVASPLVCCSIVLQEHSTTAVTVLALETLVCQWLNAANGPSIEIWPINQYEYDERINEWFPRIGTERHY